MATSRAQQRAVEEEARDRKAHRAVDAILVTWHHANRDPVHPDVLDRFGDEQWQTLAKIVGRPLDSTPTRDRVRVLYRERYEGRRKVKSMTPHELFDVNGDQP